MKMPDLELRKLSGDELEARADELEDELALTRSLLRQARKLEESRERVTRMKSAIAASRAGRVPEPAA